MDCFARNDEWRYEPLPFTNPRLIQLTPAARRWLAARGYDMDFGARPMARLIQQEIKRPLAEEMLFGQLKDGGRVEIDVGPEDGLVLAYTPLKAPPVAPPAPAAPACPNRSEGATSQPRWLGPREGGDPSSLSCWWRSICPLRTLAARLPPPMVPRGRTSDEVTD